MRPDAFGPFGSMPRKRPVAGALRPAGAVFAPPGSVLPGSALPDSAIPGDPARALVLSQIILSLALPIPMIPLVLFTMRREIMGPLANRGLTNAAAIAGTVLVLGLDMILLVQTAAS